MATVLNHYELNIKIDSQEIAVNSGDFTFSVLDSIHRTFNTANLILSDIGGLLQEFLSTVEGTPIELTIGTSDNQIKGTYVINKDKLEILNNNKILAGTIEIPLVNNVYYEQEKSSKVYEERISNIVRQIVNPLNFREVIINDTSNQNVWYQTYQYPIEFIEKRLLPYAISNNSNRSPFFMFIDSSNAFNFRNFGSMNSSNSLGLVTYRPQVEGQSNFDVVLELSRFRNGLAQNHKYKKRALFKEKEDGTIESTNDTFLDYPKDVNRLVPIYKHDLLTSTLDTWLIKTKDNVDGFIINSTKEALFQDKFIIVIPLDTRYIAGKKITLEVFYPDKKDNLIMSQFSDDYLIEESEHIWKGDNKLGLSKLTISRKNLLLNSDYLIKPSLMGGV